METQAITHSFEVEGRLTNMRREGDRPCLCCGDGGHVYSYYVELPGFTEPTTLGDRPLTGTTWLHDVLYPLRKLDGAKVKITVEVEP